MTTHTVGQNKLVRILFFLVLITGLVMRFYQFLMGRSLWEDETHLALNFMKRGYVDLLKPLDYLQGAPVLFLLLTKLFVQLFGYSEIAFHLLPFISSILTLPLFFYLLLELTKSSTTALIGFFVFSTNLALIYFSSELKPYAIDVSVYVLMIYLAVSQNSFVVKRRNLLLAVAGAVSLLISLSSFIVIFCVGCYLLLNWFQQKKVNRREVLVMAIWALVFAANYFLFIHKHPSTAQQRFNYASAFCPTDLLSCEFSNFLRTTVNDVFFEWIMRFTRDFGFGYIIFILLVTGVGTMLAKKSYTLLIFICVPVVLHLLLSMLQFYPFVFRLILYQVPALITVLAIGTNSIGHFFARFTHQWVKIIFALICCYGFTKNSIAQFPLWRREIKPAIDFVNNTLPNEHVYVEDPINAYTYYQNRGYAKNKLYRGLPWVLSPEEFYEMTACERSNFALFYSETYSQLGYGAVIEDLKKRNLIARQFAFNGYIVSEIKPLRVDTADGTYIKTLDYTWFDPNITFGDERIVPLWGQDAVPSKPLGLKKGKYKVVITSKGTPVDGVNPHINVQVNDKKVGDFFNPMMYGRVSFAFELDKDTTATFKLNMDNDAMGAGEDRNSFILYLEVFKTADAVN